MNWTCTSDTETLSHWDPPSVCEAQIIIPHAACIKQNIVLSQATT